MNNQRSIKFTVEGKPIGKARPRFRRIGKFTSTYTPKKTVDYENTVRASFKKEAGKSFKPIEGPIEVDATIVFDIPKSVSKKKREEMIGTPVLKKPDTDNIVKSILDPLNNIAYSDDSQVCKITAFKYYGNNPRVDVTIREYKENDNIIRPIRIFPFRLE